MQLPHKSSKLEKLLSTPKTPFKKPNKKHFTLTPENKIKEYTPDYVNALTIFTETSYQREQLNGNYFDQYFEKIKKIGHGDYGNVFLTRRILDCSKIGINKMTTDNILNTIELQEEYILNQIDANNKNTKEIEQSVFYTLLDKSPLNISNHLATVKVSHPMYPDNKTKIKEVELLYKLKNNSNIVQIESAWLQYNTLYIKTEYCQFDLKQIIDIIYFHNKSRIKKYFIYKLMIDISNALNTLNKLKIIHGDVKPENILIKINESGEIQFMLADFNISHYLGDSCKDGDRKYLAIEKLQGICTMDCDVFSLGLIYFEMIKEVILPGDGSEWGNIRNNFDLYLENEDNIVVRMCGYYKDRPLPVEIIEHFKKKIIEISNTNL